MAYFFSATHGIIGYSSKNGIMGKGREFSRVMAMVGVRMEDKECELGTNPIVKRHLGACSREKRHC